MGASIYNRYGVLEQTNLNPEIYMDPGFDTLKKPASEDSLIQRFLNTTAHFTLMMVQYCWTHTRI